MGSSYHGGTFQIGDTLSGFHYSGAEVSGIVSFECNNCKKSFTFKGEKVSPFSISSKFSTPSDAPFKGALTESQFYSKMAGVVVSADRNRIPFT